MRSFSLCRLFCGALLVFAVTFPSYAKTTAAKINRSKQPVAVQSASNQLPRLVVVGDSLSAGFYNGSLLDRQQRKGYAALVARQAGSSLVQPEIAEPGLPNVLTLVDPGPPPIIAPVLGISYGRTNPLAQVTNLAVPGADLRDALQDRPNLPIDGLTDLILGLPSLLLGVSRSQVEFTESLRPRNIIVWIGNNDALGAALAGNSTQLTPLAQFQADYTALINRLAATKARLIVANIPDVTTIPYLISAEEVAAQVGLPLTVIGPILGIGPGSYVTPSAIPSIPLILANPAGGPLSANVVLDAAEIATIQTAVNNYNAFIAAKAAEKAAVLVDINTLLRNADLNGYQLSDGRVLTTNFLGGIFSLDGVHPNATGYAVVANEFITRINQRYSTTIPLVNLVDVANNDPLVPGNYLQGRGLAVAPAEVAQSLREVFKLQP